MNEKGESNFAQHNQCQSAGEIFLTFTTFDQEAFGNGVAMASAHTQTPTLIKGGVLISS